MREAPILAMRQAPMMHSHHQQRDIERALKDLKDAFGIKSQGH
jgi:hypothetical protein